MKLDSAILFCDGACSGNPGPGGWGSITLTINGEIRELGGGRGQTTNNQMELTGAIEGLRALSHSKAPIQIYTDSTYVIRGITQWVHGWVQRGWIAKTGGAVANRDLWEELYRLTGSLKKIGLSWNYVRGHTGVEGNERCDEIAVAFSQGRAPALYRGSLDGYRVSLFPLPTAEALPASSSKTTKKTEKPTYLSLIGNDLQRHTTWPECERRVKGHSGAKFKKVTSPEEEQAVLTQWGIKK